MFTILIEILKKNKITLYCLLFVYFTKSSIFLKNYI